MIDSSKITIEKVCMHFIGNKNREEGVKFSSQLLIINESLADILTKYFLAPFKQLEYYNFYHETSLKYNEVYDYVSEMFDNNEAVYDQSINVAKHLYKYSVHPQIKSGELYIVYFKNCRLENDVVDAIGIFKSENKDTFLKVSSTDDIFEVTSEIGINISKLDKGCIVFNTRKDKGYLVTIVDNINKNIGSEAQYWINDFLQIKRNDDTYFKTQKILSLCKKFATERLSLESSSKINQVEFLNKSLTFFNGNSNFNLDEFSEKVFQKPKMGEMFQEFKNQFEIENEIQIPETFDISNSAIKKQSSSYQSVIKLDRNFHIYVHGDTDLIRNGIDEDTGFNFYSFLYKEES